MELKANELRIGNLVNYNDEYFTVLSISEDWLQLDNEYLNSHIADLQPIPLTEEWLFRFGYTEKDFSNGNIIKVINGGYIITTLSNKEIKYVHKLQNLYYELKDNELKLK